MKHALLPMVMKAFMENVIVLPVFVSSGLMRVLVLAFDQSGPRNWDAIEKAVRAAQRCKAV